MIVSVHEFSYYFVKIVVEEGIKIRQNINKTTYFCFLIKGTSPLACKNNVCLSGIG